MVGFKEYATQLEEIGKIKENLNTVIESMPECTAKKAFQYCVLNIEKKITRFHKVEINPEDILKDEQEREIIRKFRAGEPIKVGKREN